MALEDAGTTGTKLLRVAVYCFQRQLVLTQHRLRAQHDSQQDFLSSLPSPILSNPEQLLPPCSAGDVTRVAAVSVAWGWLGEDKDGLTAFGASSSADLVVGLVELALMPPLHPSRMELCAQKRRQNSVRVPA